MKLSGLVPMQALGMSAKGNRLVKENEIDVCPKCGKEVCECGMGEDTVPTDKETNVANGLPQTQGDEKKLTLSREHFKNIVREVMKEESEYQRIFQKMLSKFGVNSPADLTPEQKKKFFTLVKGVQTELAERMKIKEAELSAGQKKLDVDGDGEIEGSDLAKLRNKNENRDYTQRQPGQPTKQEVELRGNIEKLKAHMRVMTKKGEYWERAQKVLAGYQKEFAAATKRRQDTDKKAANKK